MYWITIPLALLSLTVVYIYFKLQIPKHLVHIPHAYTFEWLNSLFNRKPFDERVKEILDLQYSHGKVQLDWRLGTFFARVMSADAAKKIYSDPKSFDKLLPSDNYPDRLFSKFLGDSVVFSSHQIWKKHRKVVNPPFKKQFEVKSFVDTTRQFFSLVDTNKSKRFDELHKAMQRITMDCMCKDLMGLDFNSIINPKVPFLTAYNMVMKGATNPLFFVFPFLDNRMNPYRRPYFEQLDKLNKIFKDILKEKREALEKNPDVDDSKLDLLSLLIKAGQDETNEFSDLDIQNNITTFLLAGHDTTAFTLSAILHLLATHPEIQEKARREVMSVMGYKYTKSNAHQATAPTLEQTKQLTYLFAIMKETMRIYPSVARLPDRYAVQDVEVDGYIIPKGTGVMLDTYCLHRDPNNFKDPDSFIPERFLNEQGELIKDPLGYAPFGGGSRLCLGINFSLLEQKVVLAMILCRYRLKNSQLDFNFKPLLLPNASSIEFVPLHSED